MSLSFPVAPMKATLGSLPTTDDGWAYEIKWDGHRTLAHVAGGSTRLQTTSGRDSGDRWPEVTAIADAVHADSMILDGEMLVIGEDGRPSFDLVQRRDPGRHPALFHAFDVLSINGTDTVGLGYTDRRALLRDVLDDGDHWAVPSHHLGGGAELLAATADQQLEGLIAKRVDSTYRPGTRSKDWLKIKNRVRVDVVIGGFTAGTGNRSTTFGSLLVGLVEDGRLRFAGGVGTGFTHDTLERLVAAMRPLATSECPFDPEPPSAIRRTATWVRPELTATVEIAEFTNDGHVRHASFVELAG
ncbi:non-homologous end-joining DNA ligase [Ilumatobacter nonamiensis]|uniref:non-homologous end-joining DNA ligase n=1 Tax=Ilumatobacter nonamiensis TaxID=467093 RepID=UPI00034C7CB3|nr:non-homologous end-joining DNA ligase [Ilumatobacter nonamiensis]